MFTTFAEKLLTQIQEEINAGNRKRAAQLLRDLAFAAENEAREHDPLPPRGSVPLDARGLDLRGRLPFAPRSR